MGILSGGGGAANFDRLLESATSQLQLEPNWAHILELCDSIRQKDVPAKYAVSAIRRKISDKNPHVGKFALVTLEACMKNCGEPIHDEVATRDFMDELRNLLKTGSDPVKEQILSMVQTWNQTLGKKASYRIIQDTYNLLKAEGYSFPHLSESEAMYLAETAPEWAEGDVCHQCRVKFSTFTRQHHCRCCGQVFCAKCSSKNSIIPKFGIEREVRVCDACYDNINPASSKKKSSGISDSQSLDSDDLPPEYLNSSLAKESQTKPQPSEAEIKAQEEEELQLAMALSLSAAESEQQQQPKRNLAPSQTTTPYTTSSSSSLYSEPKSNLYADVVTDSKRVSNSVDAELSHYLNRDYWEKKKDNRSAEPSAPAVHEQDDVIARGSASYASVEKEENEENGEENSGAFVATFSNSIEMFINRIQTVQSKGKHIAMDSTVQSLFQSLSAMHPQLMKLIEDEEDNKAKYQAMLEKIAVIREARESLDDMRNQHREKLNQQELEQEMLRRMQMEQKLELMRQQKQEYLEYQRQLQIQRQQAIEQQQQLKMQQKQYQYQDMNQPQYGYQQRAEYEAGQEMYRSGGSYLSMPVDQQATSVPYQQQTQFPHQQTAGQESAVAGQQMYEKHPGVQPPAGKQPLSSAQPPSGAQPSPGSQPPSGAQPNQQGYMNQSQIHANVGQNPQQFPTTSQAQPQSSAVPYSQAQQQPPRFTSKAPDLLDAPIGSELDAQRHDSQQQGYGNQQFQRDQMAYVSNQEHQMTQQRQYQQPQQVSQHQQQQSYQSLPQNPTPPQHQAYPQISKQQGSMQEPGVKQQDANSQQRIPNGIQGGIQQQPGVIQQPPVGMRHPQGGMQQQSQGGMQHPQALMQQQGGGIQHPQGGMQPERTQQPQASMQPQSGRFQQQTPGSMQQPQGVVQQQGGIQQQPSIGNQRHVHPQHQSYPQSQPTASQPYQDAYGQQPDNIPSQYSQQHLPHSQGPASLPYTSQPSNPNMAGPASLPANMNQFPNEGQGYFTDRGYSQNQQTTGYIQQQQQQPRNPEPQLTEGMKDLQLISFE